MVRGKDGDRSPRHHRREAEQTIENGGDRASILRLDHHASRQEFGQEGSIEALVSANNDWVRSGRLLGGSPTSLGLRVEPRVPEGRGPTCNNLKVMSPEGPNFPVEAARLLLGVRAAPAEASGNGLYVSFARRAWSRRGAPGPDGPPGPRSLVQHVKERVVDR